MVLGAVFGDAELPRVEKSLLGQFPFNANEHGDHGDHGEHGDHAAHGDHESHDKIASSNINPLFARQGYGPSTDETPGKKCVQKVDIINMENLQGNKQFCFLH